LNRCAAKELKIGGGLFWYSNILDRQQLQLITVNYTDKISLKLQLLKQSVNYNLLQLHVDYNYDYNNTVKEFQLKYNHMKQNPT